MSADAFLPVARVREIGKELGADAVVVVAWWSEGDGRTNVATWGNEIRHKYWAADLGERFAEVMGAAPLGHVHEDFRTTAPRKDAVPSRR